MSVAIIRTDDGFEFETIREEHSLRCVCRRDGLEAEFVINCRIDGVLDQVLIEQVEIIARNAWLVSEKMGREGLLGPQNDENHDDSSPSAGD